MPPKRDKKGMFSKNWKVKRVSNITKSKKKDNDNLTCEEALAYLSDIESDNEENVALSTTEEHVKLTGARIIDYSYFGSQLSRGCLICGKVICIDCVVKEVRKGLASILTIDRENCHFHNKVHTSKYHSDPLKDNRSVIHDLSTAAAGILYNKKHT